MSDKFNKLMAVALNKGSTESESINAFLAARKIAIKENISYSQAKTQSGSVDQWFRLEHIPTDIVRYILRRIQEKFPQVTIVPFYSSGSMHLSYRSTHDISKQFVLKCRTFTNKCSKQYEELNWWQKRNFRKHLDKISL